MTVKSKSRSVAQTDARHRECVVLMLLRTWLIIVMIVMMLRTQQTNRERERERKSGKQGTIEIVNRQSKMVCCFELSEWMKVKSWKFATRRANMEWRLNYDLLKLIVARAYQPVGRGLWRGEREREWTIPSDTSRLTPSMFCNLVVAHPMRHFTQIVFFAILVNNSFNILK